MCLHQQKLIKIAFRRNRVYSILLVCLCMTKWQHINVKFNNTKKLTSSVKISGEYIKHREI